MTIHIRKATPADAPAITTLMTSLGYPDVVAPVEKWITRLLAHPDEQLLVAVNHAVNVDEVIGVISLHFIPQLALEGDFCRISHFCVSEDARSEGIGAALEAKPVELARQRKCDRIVVHCHSRRQRAHDFSDRQEYVESPEYLIKSLSRSSPSIGIPLPHTAPPSTNTNAQLP